MSGSVYLEKLAEFSALLRAEGLAVGLKETADACRVLSCLDLADRETVRGALGALYAKSREEQVLFRRAFDGFFVSLEQREAVRRRQEEEARELEQRRAEADEELRVGGKPMDLREDLREVYVRMDEQKREELRQMMEKTRELLRRNPEKLYGNFIRSVFTRFLLEQQMALEDAATGVQAADPELSLLYQDISKFREADIPRAAALIASISRQLDAELSRRRQGRGRSGKLNFKRTIRRGLETGGSFYRLCYKRRRQAKHRLVLLCDVSGSMLQFSEFALRFLKSMSEVSEASEIYLFSEEVRFVDSFALQNMDAFRDYVRASGLFGRGTNLGLALEYLCSRRPAVLGPSTTLVILSDTKTVNIPRAAQLLAKARQQAGKVLWLNPIPESKWPYLRSVQAMSMLCQMLPCSTLNELARACRKMVQ